jgi:shikimate kinase
MRIFIIGPGGVGKSSSGVILAELLGYKFIDLDAEFCGRIGNIGEYIRAKSYEDYCRQNSELFYLLLGENLDNYVFVLSSGFLVHENMGPLTKKHRETLKKVGTTILLIPSKSLKTSTETVVARQLSRGFGLNEENERIKFEKRFGIYQKFGDVKIFSRAMPKNIAKRMKIEVDKWGSKPYPNKKFDDKFQHYKKNWRTLVGE